MAILDIVDKLTASLDAKEFEIGVFIDLSNAFDTVDHSILLVKLSNYGVRGSAYGIISSYLSGRSQYINYNNTNSSKQHITCVVPQGSILGPLLF